jgi:hypothetical protein
MYKLLIVSSLFLWGIRPSINKPINQSTNQPTNQSTNQPVNQSTNQPTNQSTNQLINQQTNEPVPKLTWKIMQNIRFEKKYYKEVQDYMLSPIFTDEIKNLQGKMVEVEGYVIPFDEKGETVVLSANPYAACFFCGKAGPASVMTIKLKKTNKTYQTDDYHHFQGILRLNFSDINEFYYILEQGEAIH